MDLNAPATQAALGELTGISQQAVSEMRLRGILSANATLHRWNLEYCAHIREMAAGRAGQIEAGLTAERARLARNQADKLEMQNAVTRRELAPVALIEEVLAKAGARVAGILDAIPGAVRRRAPELPGEVVRFVEEEIARARNIAAQISLADVVEKAAEDSEDDDPEVDA